MAPQPGSAQTASICGNAEPTRPRKVRVANRIKPWTKVYPLAHFRVLPACRSARVAVMVGALIPKRLRSQELLNGNGRKELKMKAKSMCLARSARASLIGGLVCWLITQHAQVAWAWGSGASLAGAATVAGEA